MSVLILRLVAPMQSWGTQSRFSVRDTAREPSKSAVVGLLCAALGRPRTADIQDLMALRMTVRIDREGTLQRDYHTAGGGKRPDGSDYGVAKANRAKAKPVVSHRYYLADADFRVALESDDERLLAEIAQALDQPKWPLYLGRRAFVPSQPLCCGVHSGAMAIDVLCNKEPWFARNPRDHERFRTHPEFQFICEVSPAELAELRPDQCHVRQDVIDRFDSRDFQLRHVQTRWLALPPRTHQRGSLMFLSSLKLNLRSRKARRDMHDVYEMHRTLMTAFPDKDDGGAGLVLWRLDTDRRSGTSRVLVQSEKKPDWDKLVAASPDYLPRDAAECGPSLQTKPLPDVRFQRGQCLAFRLRANPTVKRNGKRHGLLTEEEQAAWLHRKAEALGFRIVSASITPERPVESGKETGRKMKFVSVLFQGQLVVSDPNIFLSKAVESGIGSAKAFGFGLLSISRL